MLIKIEFSKSTSPNYNRAIALAKRATQYREEQRDGYPVHIAMFELTPKAIRDFFALREVVSSWKSTCVSWEDGSLLPLRFDEALHCYIERCRAIDPVRYCNGQIGHYTYGDQSTVRFGCKLVILDGSYWHSSPHWYDFGRFNDSGVFFIDKAMIRNTIKLMLIDNGRDSCPGLDWNYINSVIDSLPDSIDPRNSTEWEYKSEGSQVIGVQRRRAGTTSSYSVSITMPSEDDEKPRGQGQGEDRRVVSRVTQSKGDHNSITYSDIGGLDREITEIRELIELPIKYPEVIKRLGIRPHKGILLYGPPGCGKTLIARALADECGVAFIPVNGPECLSMWHGESERKLREVFKTARDSAPSIIFFDELDSFAFRRDRASESFEATLVSQFLALMDGFSPLDRVWVIGTTNRLHAIDPALLRPGRFDRVIKISLPDEEGRARIFRIHSSNMPLDSSVSFHMLAQRTQGYSGADIMAVCSEAAMNALRRVVGRTPTYWSKMIEGMETKVRVTQQDFLNALLTVQPSQWEEPSAEGRECHMSFARFK